MEPSGGWKVPEQGAAPKPSRSALTNSLQHASSGPVNIVNGKRGGAPEAKSSEQEICPPESFPCLYPNAGTFDPSPFDNESAKASMSMGSYTNGGWSLSQSYTGHSVADYEENPFSRRKSEFAKSPSLGKFRQSWLGSPAVVSNYLSEVTVGSLPKGLTPEERATISSSRAPSFSGRALQALPVDQASAPTAEGRDLRRGLLKGSVLVFITAGYSGKRFIYERAKELGVRTIMIDGPDSWSKSLEEEGIIEKFYPFDWSDNDTVFQRCLELIRRIEQEVGQLDGVLSFWEVAQPLVARLAEKLGLPGNTPESVDAARDKKRTREIMDKAGLPTPLNALISTAGDLDSAADLVGFPSVIKPISGAASLGVVRVNSREELHTTYKRVMREVTSIRLNDRGDFITADLNEEELEEEGNLKVAGGEAVAVVFMLEQYLDGPEVDVDVVISQGEAVYGAITDNWPTIEPYFNETGSNCPSILPLERQRGLCELAVRSVLALGFKTGVFHVEAKDTSNRGPHIIEINARMGGGPVRSINLIVWGVDLVEEQLLGAAGIASRPLVARMPLVQIAEYSVNAKETGIVVHTDFLKEWVSHPDVLYARPLVEAGDRVVSITDGLPTWVYEMMVSKPTVEEAIDFVKQIEAAVPVPVTPT